MYIYIYTVIYTRKKVFCKLESVGLKLPMSYLKTLQRKLLASSEHGLGTKRWGIYHACPKSASRNGGYWRVAPSSVTQPSCIFSHLFVGHGAMVLQRELRELRDLRELRTRTSWMTRNCHTQYTTDPLGHQLHQALPTSLKSCQVDLANLQALNLNHRKMGDSPRIIHRNPQESIGSQSLSPTATGLSPRTCAH